MATKLFDALLSLARYALPVHSGVATGGSTTTLADVTRTQIDDQFNAGVIFFLTGTFADTYAHVTDYNGTTGTFTFASVGGAGIVAGVLYAAFPLMSGMNYYDMVGAINEALVECGEIRKWNEALTTVDGQEEYTLPSGVSNIKNMWIASDTAEPYGWRRFTHYKELSGELHIPKQWCYTGDSYPIRLEYKGPHDTLDSADDTLDQQINPQWLKYAAALNLIRAAGNRGDSWKALKVNYEECQRKFAEIPKKRSITVSIHGA